MICWVIFKAHFTGSRGPSMKRKSSKKLINQSSSSNGCLVRAKKPSTSSFTMKLSSKSRKRLRIKRQHRQRRHLTKPTKPLSFDSRLRNSVKQSFEVDSHQRKVFLSTSTWWRRTKVWFYQMNSINSTFSLRSLYLSTYSGDNTTRYTSISCPSQRSMQEFANSLE